MSACPVTKLTCCNVRKMIVFIIGISAIAATLACGSKSSSSGSGSAGPAAQIGGATGSGQSASVGTAFPNPFSATVEDSKNNPVSGASVTFTAPSSGASGTFANGKTTETDTTNSSGVATSSTFTANSTVSQGAYTVTASVSGITNTLNYTLLNVPAATVTVSPNSTGQGALINTAFGQPLQVTISEPGQNSSEVTVTFQAPSSGASGTFAGGSNTATVTTTGGTATAPAFTANGTTGVYQVTATASDSPTSVTFDLVNVSSTSSPFPAGNYVFSLSGTDTHSSFYNLAGVFAVNADGLITGGYQTFADFTYATPYEPIANGGALVKTSDGNVRIVLSTGNTNVGVGATGEEMFDAAVVSDSKAFLSEFDGWATASGELDLQTLPTSSQCPNVVCNYAFLVSGQSPGASTGPFAMGGIFDVTAPGTISGGVFDANDKESGQLFQDLSILPQSSFNTKSAGYGVLQFSLSLSGFESVSSIEFDGYVVDSNHIRLIESGGASFVSSGLALLQTGASLGSVCSSGSSYVVGMNGEDVHGVLQVAGLFTMPTSSSVNIGGFINYNDPSAAGTQPPLAITGGTCAPDTTYLGRVFLGGITIQDSGASPHLQFYVTGDSDGDVLALSLDSNNAIAGHGYQQNGGPFTDGGFNGTYALSMTGANNVSSSATTADEFDAVGTLTANGSGAISGSGSVDLNWIFNTGPTTGLSVSSGSYTVNSNGVFTGGLTGLDAASSGTSDAFSYYLVDHAGTNGSSSRIIAIETDTNQLSLDFFEQQ
ncbi:MAG TPA: hypothetical protein VGG14_02870 [Candidatus Sulfotelmatobacter sp.]